MIVHLWPGTMIVYWSAVDRWGATGGRLRAVGLPAFARTRTGVATTSRLPMVAHDGGGLPGHAIAVRDRVLGQNRATIPGHHAGVGLHRAAVDRDAGARRPIRAVVSAAAAAAAA